MGANGSTPRLRRKNSPGEGSDTGSRKSKNGSDGSIKPLQEKEKDKAKKDDAASKKDTKPKNKFSAGGSKRSGAPMANIDSDSEEGALSYLESDVDYHTPPQPRKGYSPPREATSAWRPATQPPNSREGFREVKEINRDLVGQRRTALNDVNRDTKDVKDFKSSKNLTGAAAVIEKALTLDNNLTRFARGTSLSYACILFRSSTLCVGQSTFIAIYNVTWVACEIRSFRGPAPSIGCLLPGGGDRVGT